MNKIKIIACLLALAMLSGCTEMVYDETEPAPTPMPLRMAVVAATDTDAFSRAVERSAGNEIMISAADNIKDADFDVTLLYMPDPGILSATTGCEVVLTDDADHVPENVSAVAIDNDAAVRAAWDALYTYPSHSTPIRILTLTEGGAGLSREMFETMLTEGKLQDKGNYIGSHSQQEPEEWVSQRLQDIPVGLLDTIYAETEELAIAAYNALRAAERNDSVEVICPVLTDRLIELMVEDHWSMGVCVGVSMEAGVEAMLELAEELVETGETRTVSVEPVVVYSDDVKALVDSGVTDIAEIMSAFEN
ncbi:MAG: hypothetical protein IJD61_01775 [Clostridia bacterium]|nr:hypothetical protein [Clostridia bacterium]